MDWHSCAQESIGDAATFLLWWSSWKLLNASNTCATIVFDHNARFALCRIAAGCKTHCTGCAKRRSGLQKLQKR